MEQYGEFGNNENGNLGNGNTENKIVPEKVRKDEDTYLENVVKIAVGTDHALALTKDGYVYTWGLNANGQCGIGNTENLKYAKAVLSKQEGSYLTNIVDISAGEKNSIAVDKEGNVYTWGNRNTRRNRRWNIYIKFITKQNCYHKSSESRNGSRACRCINNEWKH
ncbi:MAG: hypothetical protein HFJ50_06895 [Clostridia bacterium]|jgi:alpha-tubulin suppressor-like RCC1 family protein|nr:hypothetical protein [Clostridia bacterium]